VSAARRRHRHLQGRFGPEYSHTVDSAESRRQAERELRDREAQHAELDLKPLSDAARERYESQWSSLQQSFVDRPQVAVADADSLVTDEMRERGYPVDDFDADRLVSVDHPDVVEHRRPGTTSTSRPSRAASTEDLLVAVISYRALFEGLVREGAEPTS
jgi:hypothetical protein